MANLHIFVVDDDRDFAQSLADIFDLEGHRVDTAFSGEEAIEKARRHPFDVMFIDVKLPGINGVESFQEVRKIRPNTRVFMMTGYSVERLLEQAVAEGAEGVLHKPLDIERVLEMVDRTD